MIATTRLKKSETEMLDFIKNRTDLTGSEVIRIGLRKMHEEVQKTGTLVVPSTTISATKSEDSEAA